MKIQELIALSEKLLQTAKDNYLISSDPIKKEFWYNQMTYIQENINRLKILLTSS